MIRHHQHRIGTSFVTAIAGLVACIIVGAGIYEASTHYAGNGFYSPKNHFISELGLASSTTMANFFNHSLNVAGLLLLIFVIGLGRYLGNGRAARGGIITGIIATVNFSAIGYFTAADWLQHIIVASIFFGAAMLSVSAFCYCHLAG